MDTTIYEQTIDHYVKKGLPETPGFNIVMLDTNVWTEAARDTRNSANYHSFILEKMFSNDLPLVIPEVILRECAGSGEQVGMDHNKFNQLYDQAFRAISALTDIHIVTFSDLENMMLESNGGRKDYALRQALQIAKELNTNNSHVMAALSTVQQFTEIEDALTIIPKDAGERVLLFYTMIFLSEYWSVDILTNETEVYTDRVINARKEKLRELLGSLTIEDFHESFRITSFDVVLFDVLSEQDSQWSEETKREFIAQCRSNRTRKIRVHSQVANFTNVETCHNNADFLVKFGEWKLDSTHIIF